MAMNVSVVRCLGRPWRGRAMLDIEVCAEHVKLVRACCGALVSTEETTGVLLSIAGRNHAEAQ